MGTSAESDAPIPSSPPTESRVMRPLREILQPKKYDDFET